MLVGPSGHCRQLCSVTLGSTPSSHNCKNFWCETTSFERGERRSLRLWADHAEWFDLRSEERCTSRTDLKFMAPPDHSASMAARVRVIDMPAWLMTWLIGGDPLRFLRPVPFWSIRSLQLVIPRKLRSRRLGRMRLLGVTTGFFFFWNPGPTGSCVARALRSGSLG